MQIQKILGSHALTLSFFMGCFLFSTSVFAQKTEYRVTLNFGLFSSDASKFTGVSTWSDMPFLVEEKSTFWSKNGTLYGIYGDIRRISKENFILGANFGTELWVNKVPSHINYAFGKRISAFSNSYLIQNTLNSTPYFGYRFKKKQANIDWTFGLDIAYNLAAKGKDMPLFILRPQTQIAVFSNKIGGFMSYSLDALDYSAHYTTSSINTFSRLFRLGLTYKIK